MDAARAGGGASGKPGVATLRPDAPIRSGRLAGLTMWQAIFVLSWPILVESFMASLVGFVDTLLSAAISVAATDAIGGASYIMWFLNLIGLALGVGATAMISRAIGKGRRAVADATTGQTMLLAFTLGAVVAAIVFALAPEISRMLQLEGEAQESFIVYLRICALGVPALGVFGSGAACCRGAGDSLRPLIIMVIVNAVNIVVSWVLCGVDIAVSRMDETGEFVSRTIIANPFGFDMGIRGIAIGTLTAWIAGGLIVLWWLVRGSSGVRLKKSRLKPHWITMRRLIRVGLPNFIETFGMWFGNFLILLFVGWMAAPGLLGAHIVAIRVEAFSFLPGFAMGLAAATLAGQYIGAGAPHLARIAILRCTAIAAGLMGLFGVAFMLFPNKIVGLFSQQPEHMELAPPIIFIAGMVQIPFAIMLVLRTGMRGAGDTKVAMILTWTATYGIRLPLAYALCGVDIILPGWLGGGVIVNPFPFDYGLYGLWIGLCLEIVIRAMLFGGRFLHGGWSRVKV
ncbi:MAG: MATE family efflux transporter [Phycisphaeraceae bacterium]|nr:MAG: MATE family efflux transporter [Phycisphaeraceae bacterium]